MSDCQRKSFDLVSDVFSSPPALSSLQANWKEITLEENYVPQGQLPEICLNQHTIGINLGKHFNCKLKADGHFIKYPILMGDSMIIPAGFAYKSHLDRATNSLVLSFSNAILTRNASELWDVDTFELIPNHSVRDPLITSVGTALRRELKMNTKDSRIYVETMANALAVHLLKNFSSHGYKTIPSAGNLCAKKLKDVLDYINDNLDQNISTAELAELAQLSQYHFSRAFKQSTGLSPYQYVIQQRVAKAKQLLSQQEMTISEVALMCGFTHQSHLNRHFKRLLNLTPKEFLNQ